MRSMEDTAPIALIDDILYAGDKSDAGVGTGRRRQFLNLYGFRFSITLWNVLEIALWDSVVLSAVQTVLRMILRILPPILIIRIFLIS
jgi:hypothetical protein